MTTPMLEKCAFRLFVAEHHDCDPETILAAWTQSANHDFKPHSVRLVRAVLEALLEPDEGMVKAMADFGRHGPASDTYEGGLRGLFSAAIQHILKGEGNV